MAEITSDGGGNAQLGYGEVYGNGEGLDAIDNALRLATPGAWLRLYLTLPQSWKASSLVQAAGLKRVTNNTMAFDWKNDGAGLAGRRQVIAALVESQTRGSSSAIWQLEQISGIPSQGGVTTTAPTAPPFGWEWQLPNVKFPDIKMPEVKIPEFPDVRPVIALGLAAVVVAVLFSD